MANPLLGMMGNMMMGGMGGNGGNNPLQMLQQFNKFKQSMQGKDPNAMLNEMLNSGQVSQEQVNQAKQMAEQFSSFLK